MIWAVAIIICFGVGAIIGAPYVPIRRQDAKSMMELADVTTGTRVLDLGSGDGRLLREVARRGGVAIGYEINPLLYLVSLVLCFRWRRRITIHLGNYWQSKWPDVDVVAVFLIDRYMPKLERELRSRLTSPTKLVSYVFLLPLHRPIASTKNCYLYQLGN